MGGGEIRVAAFNDQVWQWEERGEGGRSMLLKVRWWQYRNDFAQTIYPGGEVLSHDRGRERHHAFQGSS